MNAAKDAQFWNSVAEKYARSTIADPVGYERTLNCTRDHLVFEDRVLELGCGTGTTALRLAHSVQFYLATDISAQMIAIAQEKLLKESVPGLRFETATVESLEDKLPFDVVLGFNYLHLVRDLHGTLQQIHALLKVGGLFISKTPCVGDMSILVRLAIPLMRIAGKAPYAGIFQSSELERKIADAGFDIVTVENHASKGTEVRPFIVAHKR
ncbi:MULTISPECIES: class I SAM-dependent methyltransferase [Brucella/Ochrobactrum group]|uniref:class I SAM-dependent methyltransferase n=1 Tax=Brucella/Ochrobactrum group TaxID=2826938 RepID=UPI00111FA355|nr:MULTISPECIES: class I SAM-dependent methyltransferase [Brucella/Ochrobactrum group]